MAWLLFFFLHLILSFLLSNTFDGVRLRLIEIRDDNDDDEAKFKIRIPLIRRFAFDPFKIRPCSSKGFIALGELSKVYLFYLTNSVVSRSANAGLLGPPLYSNK